MAHNIIVVLTEGEHDSAFLYRILKSNGIPTYNRKIKEYEYPLSQFLASDILNVTIEEAKVDEVRRSRFLPGYVLKLKDNLILIYSVGGDSRTDIRTKLIKALNALNVADPDQIQAVEGTSISILYFLDADELGLEKRLAEIKVELGLVSNDFQAIEKLENMTMYPLDDLKVGAYIFCDDGKKTGKLEDVLIPLMQDGNIDIFDEAKKFLSIHESTELFKGKVKVDGNGEVRQVNGKKFDLKKSIIGTVGQLQKSGKSNTVCISDADYIDDIKVKKSKVCSTIFQFIQSVMTP